MSTSPGHDRKNRSWAVSAKPLKVRRNPPFLMVGAGATVAFLQQMIPHVFALPPDTRIQGGVSHSAGVSTNPIFSRRKGSIASNRSGIR